MVSSENKVKIWRRRYRIMLTALYACLLLEMRVNAREIYVAAHQPNVISLKSKRDQAGPNNLSSVGKGGVKIAVEKRCEAMRRYDGRMCAGITIEIM